jgi:putative membrane protein
MRTAPLVLAVSALFAACGQRSDQQNATTHDTTTAAGGEVSAAPAPAAAKAPSDAEIFALLTEANTAEIDAAKTALKKAHRTDVKAFAQQMITDHTKLLHGGKALADSLHVTPQPPATDSLATHVQQEKQTLGSTSGAAFDKTYMDAQVQDHQTVLALLQQFEGQAQDPKLKAMITKAQPIVQRHLDKAQAIDGKLAKPQA